MCLDDLIIATFCVVDDALSSLHLRVRRAGPPPTLDDSEVIAIEIVGEYLGLDEDKARFAYFRQFYAHFFPGLRSIVRTSFVRQAANLWRVMERVWRVVLDHLDYDPGFAMVDSLPIPVCCFARAKRCRLFRPEAAFGKDHVSRQTFFGFRLHARVCWPGVITEVALEPANVSEPEVAASLVEGTVGDLLADRGYDVRMLHEALARKPLKFHVQYRWKLKDPKPLLSRYISRIRYRIESIFGQLAERYNVKCRRARDFWHLAGRIIRKVSSCTDHAPGPAVEREPAHHEAGAAAGPTG